jgi:myo-inositol-1-phosphate synthase
MAGISGATASTTAAGLTAMQRRIVPEDYGISVGSVFEGLHLPNAEDFAIAGWDIYPERLGDLCERNAIIAPGTLKPILELLDKIEVRPGYLGSRDATQPGREPACTVVTSLSSGADAIARDISQMRESLGADLAIVVYLGSPPRAMPTELLDASLRDIDDEGSKCGISGALCYALGAARAGAAFVDFTPSDALDFSAIIDAAERAGVQIAGRDGSTGQTMMKMAIGGLLRRRNIRVNGWYSTNILGNNDGLVLSRPEHSVIKLRDKRESLGSVLGYDDFEHVVNIEYFAPHGDMKESWDVVECRGWLGNRISLRINWRAGDSLLAAPMILDLARFLVIGFDSGARGLQPQFGVFFKRPIGWSSFTLATLFQSLESWATNAGRTHG